LQAGKQFGVTTLLLWRSELPLGGAHPFAFPLEGFPDSWLSLCIQITGSHDEIHPVPESLK